MVDRMLKSSFQHSNLAQMDVFNTVVKFVFLFVVSVYISVR